MESLAAGGPGSYTLQEATALCAKLAKTHYENFTVVSRFLPKDKRQHFYNVYAFCRRVDDLGDEAPGDRLHLLDFWEQDLQRCYDGTPSHPYLLALQQTIRTFDIPAEPFLKLIEANRLDQTRKRHPTYEDLDFYCQHSANPVGHLVLYVCGYRDEERQRLSDCTCTALQLANFWQDVARDYAIGRIYIPVEDMDRFGYTEEDLARGVVNDAFRQLMAFEVERARNLFREGLKLVGMIRGTLKLDIALFSLGGMRVLDLIEKQDYDVLGRRPSLSKAGKMGLMVKAIWLLATRSRIW